MLALLGSGAAAGAGFESRWTNGLQVRSETVPGATAINGVEFRMTRVTGRDVPALFARIVADWNATPGANAPRLLQQGAWSLASRLHEGHSQVVQWRQGEEGAELLWSDTDLRTPASPARLPRYLPADCKWSGPVQGRSVGQQFLQATGFCRAHAPDVTAQLERSLNEEGWRTRRTPAGLHANGRGRSVEAIVSEARGFEPGGTSVVVVETSEAPAQLRRNKQP